MISVAMIAIFLAVPMAANSIHYLNQESDYRFAVRNSRHQMEALRKAEFSHLPPETVRVGWGGWVILSHTDLVSCAPRTRRPPCSR